MAREFEVLNADIKFSVDNGGALTALDELSKGVNKLAGTKTTDLSKLFDPVNKSAGGLAASIDNLSAKVKSNGQVFQVVQNQAGTYTVALDKAASQSATLGARLNALDKAGLTNMRTFKEALLDVGTGFNVIAQGGSKLVALRQIMFGVGSSTNGLAKALDSLTDGSSRNLLARFVDFATGGFTQLSDRQKGLALNSRLTSERLADIGTAGQSALRTIKDLAKSETGVKKEAFDGVSMSIKNVTNEFQKLARVIHTGGAPTQAQIDRITEEVRTMEKEFEFLSKQDIVSAEAKARLEQLRIALGSSKQALKLLTEEMKILEAEEAKESTAAQTSTKSQKQKADSANTAAKAVTNISNSTKSAVTNISNYSTTINNASQSTRTFGEAVKASFLGNFLANAASNLTSQLSRIPGILISAASNAAETQNRFEAVFKESTPAAEDFIKTLASTVGRDPFKIKESMSSLQSFTIGLGFSQDQSTQMSEALQTMTLDFASFNNISDEDASQRFIAALSGSSEVLDRFGVNIKEAALEQESFRIGINKSSKDLTEQEKVLLRLSIIQNSMTSQGAMGDASKTAGSFANQLKALNANLSQMATAIGTQLLPAIAPFLQIINVALTAALPKITAIFGQIFQAVTSYLAPIAEAIRLVFDAENTSDALNNLYVVVIDTFGRLLDNLWSIANNAYDWGVSFINQIGDGMFAAIDSAIGAAVEYAGNLIASFLQPGSPPEQGPLSTIDQWGSGLLDTFGGSFKDSNFIKSLDTQLSDATKNVLALRQKVIDAEKSGYVPPELLEKLKLAEEEKKNIESQIKDQEKLNKVESKGGKTNATQSSGGHSGGSTGSPNGRVRTERQTAEQVRTDALAILDKQLKDGVIKYEEYAKERLKIEQNFYEDTLKEGQAVNQQNIDDIKKYQAEVEKILQEKKKKNFKIGPLDFDVSKLTSPALDGLNKAAEKTGKIFVTSVGKSITQSLTTLKNNIVNKFKKLAEDWGTEFGIALHAALNFRKLIDIHKGEGLPSIILSKLGLLRIVQDAIRPIFTLLGKLASSPFVKFLAGLINRMGIFGFLLKKVGGILGTLLGPLGLAFSIYAHWEDAVSIFNTVMSFSKAVIDDFIKSLGGIDKVKAIFTTLYESGQVFYADIKNIFFGLLRDLGNIDFGSAIKALFSGDFEKVWTILSTGLETAFGNAFTKVKALLLSYSKFDETLTTVVTQAVTSVGNVITAKLTALKTSIIEALPPGVISGLTEIQNKFDEAVAFVDRLKTSFTNFGNFLSTNLTPSFDNMKQSFNDFITTNAPQVQTAIDKIQSIWNTLSTAFEKNYTILSEKLSPVIERFTQALGLAGNESTGEGGGGKILQFFGAIASFTLDVVLNSITGAINLLVIGLTALDYGLKNSTPLFESIANISANFYTGMSNAVLAVEDFSNKVIEIFKNLYNELIGHSIIPDMITGITNAFSLFNTDLGVLVQQGIDFVLGLFTSFGSDAITNIIDALSAGKSTILSIISDLFGGGEESQSTTPTQPAQLDTSGTSQLTTVMAQIMPVITSNVATLQTLLDGFIQTSLTTITSIGDTILSSFLSISDILVGENSVLITMSGSVVNIITTMSAGVIAALRFMITQGSETLRRGKWVDVGKYLVLGIIQGINDNRGKFLEKVRQLAHNGISAAQQELGIASPSVVFREIGANVVEGFSIGMVTLPDVIGSSIGQARDVAEKIAETVLDPSKVKIILSNATANFKKYWDQIQAIQKSNLNKNEKAAAIQELLLENVSLGQLGISGGVQGQAVARALNTLIYTTFQNVPKLIEQSKVQAADGLEAITNQMDEVVGKFRTATENVRFQTNSTRNAIEDAFDVPITDTKLQELYNSLGAGADYGTDLNNQIKLAYLSQQKLNGALEDQAAVEEQIRKIGEAQAEYNSIIPPKPPQIPVSQLDEGLKLLDALKLGLDSTVPDVLSTLAGLSKDMIEQLKKNLQINSPSKVLMSIGKNTGLGLAQGIQSTYGNVHTALANITNGIISTAKSNEFTLDPNTVAQQSPVAITINNTIGNNMDLAYVEQRLLNTIKKEIRR